MKKEHSSRTAPLETFIDWLHRTPRTVLLAAGLGWATLALGTGCGPDDSTSDPDPDTQSTADVTDTAESDTRRPRDTGSDTACTADSDDDGTPDCRDECPNDPSRTEPGACGCGAEGSSEDTDGDGTPDCNDQCPQNPDKVAPNACGCDRVVCFAGGISVPIGGRAKSVAATDVDGDDVPDVLFAADNASLHTARNRGDGTFQSDEMVDAGADTVPGAMATGDLDGDGASDVVLADKGDVANQPKLTVLFNDGSGSFGSKETFKEEDRNLEDVAIADLDGDGALDILSASSPQQRRLSDTVAVYSGRGDGSFEGPTRYDIEATPAELAVADVDGDGVEDVLTANFTSISLLSGKGDGTFEAATTIDVPVTAKSLAATKIDGDDHVDVVVGGGDPGKVWVGAGNGDGTFSAVTSLSPGKRIHALEAADFDGDGRPDFAVLHGDHTDDSLDRISVYRNQSQGTFGTSQTFRSGNESTALTSADFDGDDAPDLAVANEGVYASSIFLGEADGTFQTTPTRSIGQGETLDSELRGVGSADLDGDGAQDVLASYRLGLAVLPGNGDGTVGTQRTVDIPTPFTWSTADLNDDGALDIVYARLDSPILSVRLGKGDGTFRDPESNPEGSTRSVGENPTSVQTADLDGDGQMDAVTANETGENVTVLLGNGDGSFEEGKNLDLGSNGNDPTDVATADLDGDGALDIVTSNRSDQGVSVLLGRGDGTFEDVENYDTDSSVTPEAVGVADLNGDGSPDVVVGGHESGRGLSVLLGNGDGSLQAPQNVEREVTDLLVGDFDGNGDADVFSVHNGGDAGLVWRGNGEGDIEQFQGYYTGGERPESVATTDLDGDGYLDIVVANNVSNDVGILLNGAN